MKTKQKKSSDFTITLKSLLLFLYLNLARIASRSMGRFVYVLQFSSFGIYVFNAGI